MGCSPAFANPFYSPPPLLDNWYPDGHVVVPHCCFDLHFLMASDTEYLFMCLLAIHISFLNKCLFKPFTHFWIFFFFGLLEHGNSLYILVIDPSLDICFVDIFSYSMSYLFTLLTASFDTEQFIILMKISLSIFFLVWTFGVISKKSLLNRVSGRFSPVFSSKGFISYV